MNMQRRRRACLARQLRLEPLESRRVLAAFTVTNLNDAAVNAADDAPGTLRQALFDANASPGADEILFQAGVGGVITLTAGELSVTDAVTIVGPGADIVTVDAAGNDVVSPGTADGSGSRVLNVDDGAIGIVQAVSISGLTLTGGDVAGDGGGIRSLEALELSNVTITGNAAVATDARGGGLFSYAGNLSISESTLSDNSAIGTGASGGGLFNTTRVFGKQTSIISSSTFSANFASSRGGGLFSGNNLSEAQVLTIANSTVSGNEAGQMGGGIFAFDGDTQIAHTTVTNNTSPDNEGGGLASYGDQSTLTTVRSSIISGNSGGDLAVVSGDLNSLLSDGFNLLGTGNTFGPANALSALDNFVETGDVTEVVDPGLAALDDNGGPTETHALLPTSGAVDAGDPAAQANVGDTPEFDQRGTPFGRIRDGDSDSTAIIDIGAYELTPEPTSSSADFNQDTFVNGFDLLLWQRGVGIQSGATLVDGDANDDDAVDGDDLDIWEDMFGDGSPESAAAAVAAVAAGNVDAPTADSPPRAVRDRAFDDLAITLVVGNGSGTATGPQRGADVRDNSIRRVGPVASSNGQVDPTPASHRIHQGGESSSLRAAADPQRDAGVTGEADGDISIDAGGLRARLRTDLTL